VKVVPDAVNISARRKHKTRRPIEDVLDRLNNVKPNNGYFSALCPAHDDREPSLSVSEGDDGRVVAAGYDRLKELKKGLSAHSSIEGTAWFGIASAVGTALRIRIGEAQLEPSASS
jgi:hypothetical protein